MKLREEMPEFEGITEWVNGEVKKEDLKGAPVLVHYWSISCHTCKEALPQLNEWRDRYAEQGLRVVSIHMPRSEKDMEIEPVKEAIKKYQLTHPVAIDNSYKLVDAYKNQYVPAYYLFDADLKLRHYQAGEKGLKMLEKRLDRVLTPEETEK
ncbi:MULTISPECIES: redoxin domain-containing protein [Aneurinibacillus]|uniref:Redoxin domain-containing protein n=1 Tax=Aneurinibacillus thermoaerophilus TaxID=143495 RepID=A0A1G8CJT6_ANETH|nr:MULTISPECIES: redoxin domain-containing protein [Aneurinibacillus]AMA71934.1 thiol-disulfide oxidoreductase [Aneurinibacillus sp. XH2]MED0675514.1 redoxin domain-containing protein [Aneurinibacillus thermoaerophilus]MED0680281.1 redoxin domain-containing protein [Aneurinibacillus thermoaerophilus]MED0737092.1 redoxin domain-containing protein [Aneurinibacillus thermoaerophilus]MED0757338.1 redoxin domain-containing protein [Aneurinibacillus thermoaerophilus]